MLSLSFRSVARIDSSAVAASCSIEIITVEHADEVLREALIIEDREKYAELQASRNLRYEELYGKPKSEKSKMPPADDSVDDVSEEGVVH